MALILLRGLVVTELVAPLQVGILALAGLEGRLRAGKQTSVVAQEPMVLFPTLALKVLQEAEPVEVLTGEAVAEAGQTIAGQLAEKAHRFMVLAAAALPLLILPLAALVARAKTGS
jgi:hypothetical protein